MTLTPSNRVIVRLELAVGRLKAPGFQLNVSAIHPVTNSPIASALLKEIRLSWKELCLLAIKL